MSIEWNGFRLGTKTAKELNILQRDAEQHPLMPPTRDRLLYIPGQNGVLDFGSDLGERRFSIPCAFVYANNREELEQHMIDLAVHLIDTNDRPKYLELEFESNKGRYWLVRFSGTLDVRKSVFDGEFDLPLLAPDPVPTVVST